MTLTLLKISQLQNQNQRKVKARRYLIVKCHNYKTMKVQQLKCQMLFKLLPIKLLQTNLKTKLLVPTSLKIIETLPLIFVQIIRISMLIRCQNKKSINSWNLHYVRVDILPPQLTQLTLILYSSNKLIKMRSQMKV